MFFSVVVPALVHTLRPSMSLRVDEAERPSEFDKELTTLIRVTIQSKYTRVK